MRLELFDVRRRRPRQRTQRDDERGFVNCGILFSLTSSVQFVGLILPSNSHAEIKTRLYASAIFPISGDWDVLLPLIWNGLCDRRRAEITIMQFIGQSLPAHHFFLRHSENFYLVSYCEPSCILHMINSRWCDIVDNSPPKFSETSLCRKIRIKENFELTIGSVLKLMLSIFIILFWKHFSLPHIYIYCCGPGKGH